MVRKRSRRSRRQPERPLSQSTLFNFSTQQPLPNVQSTTASRPQSPIIGTLESAQGDKTITPPTTVVPSENVEIQNPTSLPHPGPYVEDDDGGSSNEEVDAFIHADVFDIFHKPTEPGDLGSQQPSACNTAPPDHADLVIDVQTLTGIVTAFKSFMKRTVFLGIISLYGKVRYTLEHYDHLVSLMKDVNNVNVLPCSTTMRQSIFPSLLLRLFVPSSIEWFPFKKGVSNYIASNKSTLIDSSSPRIGSQRQNEAVVVLPSDWAKMDIRTLPILRELICFEECHCQRVFGASDLRIDTTSHVVQREAISRQSHTLWVNKGGIPHPASIGTVLRCHFIDEDDESSTSNVPSGVSSGRTTYNTE